MSKATRWWECRDYDWGNGPGRCEIYYSKDVGDLSGPESEPRWEGNPMRNTARRQLMPEGFVPPTD